MSKYFCFRTVEFDVLGRDSEGNTGFYYVKSNLKMWELWASVLLEARRFPKLDDQTVFWNVVRNSALPAIFNFDTCGETKHKVKLRQPQNATLDPSLTLRMCGLDNCLFSCSVMKFPTILKQLRANKQVPYIMHANFIIGNEWKEKAMFNHKMWLVSHPFNLNDVTCRPFDENAFYALGNTK